MVITLKTSKRIKFPVYALPSDNWEWVDGLLFCEGMIVDDKNMPGDSLGIRRLQTHHRNLFPLKRQLISLNGILKQSKPYFVDSNGVVFIYEKTQFCQLKYYKIKRVEKRDTHSLLWLWKVNFPIVIPRPPDSEMFWAGVLHYHGLPWILYEYSEEYQPAKRKKV